MSFTVHGDGDGALSVRHPPGLAVTSTRRRTAKPAWWSPPCRLVATSRHLRTKAAFDHSIDSALLHVISLVIKKSNKPWLRNFPGDTRGRNEVRGVAPLGVAILHHHVLCENVHLPIDSAEGAGAALGRNSRQEDDRTPRCRLSHGNFRRLNADNHHMIKRDSPISVGAQNDWLFLSPSTSLSPFALAPEEQGSLEEGKVRVVATFGGRVHRARRQI